MNYRLLLLCILTLTALASGCGSSNNNNGNNDPTLQGMLVSGGVAVASATITIYSSSEDNGGTELGSGTSDDDGMFQFSYRNPETSDGVFYVTSSGGHLASQQDELSSAFVLASVIGAAPLPEQITINEVTTVASAFSLAQFIDGPTLNGNSVGLNMASRMLRNLANIETGESGATINNTANDPQSTYSALRTLNEMANLLVSCANDASVCQSILQLAVPLDGSPATDTFRALANMAKTPWRDPGPLFSLATAPLASAQQASGSAFGESVDLSIDSLLSLVTVNAASGPLPLVSGVTPPITSTRIHLWVVLLMAVTN